MTYSHNNVANDMIIISYIAIATATAIPCICHFIATPFLHSNLQGNSYICIAISYVYSYTGFRVQP